MTRLIIAVNPTNQDKNPVLGGGSEMAHIAPLAAKLATELSSRPNVVARLFTATPQSQDTPWGSLAGLRRQQSSAALWLGATRHPGDLTVSLNLHSDSGTYRHTGYYYDSLSGPVSEWLGRAITEAIKGYFGNKVISADYGAAGYIFAEATRAVACPLLLEMGAHTMMADVVAVQERYGPEIVATMVGVLVGFFGISTVPILNTSELRSYGEWSLARLANGQDSRNREAFRQHLAALGAPDDPYRFGMPNS